MSLAAVWVCIPLTPLTHPSPLTHTLTLPRQSLCLPLRLSVCWGANCFAGQLKARAPVNKSIKIKIKIQMFISTVLWHTHTRINQWRGGGHKLGALTMPTRNAQKNEAKVNLSSCWVCVRVCQCVCACVCVICKPLATSAYVGQGKARQGQQQSWPTVGLG